MTDQHRSWAKSVNFGVLYGKTAASLAKEWGIPKVKALAKIKDEMIDAPEDAG